MSNSLVIRELVRTFGQPLDRCGSFDSISLHERASIVVCVVDGAPVSGQTVISGGRSAADTAIPRRALRTDAGGIVTLVPSGPGLWYLTFIHIGTVSAPDRNYQSEWATITFQLR